MENIKKQIALLLLTLLLLVPALHKITSTIPPEWFLNKFTGSLLDKIPKGWSLSYYFIIFLEIIGPLLLIIGWVQMLLNKNYEEYISKGFVIYYLLFSILTFGSFLIEDYSNGFNDFIYFIGVLFIEQTFFKPQKS